VFVTARKPKNLLRPGPENFLLDNFFLPL
jgi:hypothetical protein